MWETKQQRLITILKKLSSYRPSAEWLIIFLEDMKFEDSVLNNIIQIINSSIKEMKDSKYKKNIEKSIKEIEKMKVQETKEQSEADKILLDL